MEKGLVRSVQRSPFGLQLQGMLFNFEAIKSYVDWRGTVTELCDLLTQLGFEVEDLCAPPDICSSLVVGRILSREPHPKADKLSLCQVDAGNGKPLQIVCGASNHQVGDHVVVARHGQELPGGLTIEEREVRGILSQGMMCSAREIGVGDDHEGILILPETAPVGAAASNYLTSIDLNITPNRPDCLGWIGIAREIAAATGLPLKRPTWDFQAESKDRIPIHLDDPEGCPRYLGRIIRGVKIGPSPKWLQDALTQVGLPAINNVVDATNFVLMEMGHPLHAFDLETLKGPEVRVRRARADEKITAINGLEYALTSDHLVIADRDRAIALAGIMGAKETEVSTATTAIFLECAYFDPRIIRRGEKSLGLLTDAAFRFERGMDAFGLEAVLDRCTDVILRVAGGEATSEILEGVNFDHMPRKSKINLRADRTSQVVGAHIALSTQADILRALGCIVTELDNGQMHVEVPGFRGDLKTEIDLIEELARHYGYANIPSCPPVLPACPGEVLHSFSIDKAVRSFLSDRGWLETKSFSFSKPDTHEKLNLAPDHPLRHSVAISNPISNETAHLRTTLLGSLLDVLERNVQRGEKHLRVFEFGKVYLPDVQDLLHCEKRSLGLAWLGVEDPHWASGARPFDFYDAAGLCECLFRELGLPHPALERFVFDSFHPGQSGRWTVDGKTLGVVGRLHPVITGRFDLPTDPILVEIDISALISLIEPVSLELKAPSPYPPIRRDLSLTVQTGTTAEEVLNLIRQSDTPFLDNVFLFDRYTGDQLSSGTQSLGFRLTYRSSDKTLTEDEITPVHKNLLLELNQRVGAIQRGMENPGEAQ